MRDSGAIPAGKGLTRSAGSATRMLQPPPLTTGVLPLLVQAGRMPQQQVFPGPPGQEFDTAVTGDETAATA